MVDYNIFTYGITKDGTKGLDYSKEFREYLLKCIAKAKSINYNGKEREFLISVSMTFNSEISLELADDISCVIQGRNAEAQKLRKEKQKIQTKNHE